MTSTLRAIEPEEYRWFPWRGFTFCLGLTDRDSAWTSGQSAAVFDLEARRMVIEGDMAAQAGRSYTKLLEVLAAESLTPADVVHVTENVTQAGIGSYPDAAAVRRRMLGHESAAVTTVVVDRLVRSKALIEIELHAVGASVSTIVHPARHRGSLGHSPIVEDSHGWLHVPTIVPVDEKGAVVHEDDPVAQEAYCRAVLAEELSRLGLDHTDIVSCVDYVTPDAQPVVDQVWRDRAAARGAIGTGGVTVMTRLHLPGVSWAMDVVFSRRAVVPLDIGWQSFEGLPFHAAVIADDVLTVSGLSATDHQTGGVLHPGDLGAQAEAVYRDLVEIVERAGATPADIRSTIEFCRTDLIGEYRVVAGVRERLLSAPWPASTGDLCAGFRHAETLIQTFAVAHLPTRRR